MNSTINIMWFRRDLRLHDNAALYHALKSSKPVLPIFIFDKNILDQLENKHDKRVEFILDTINEMQAKLVEHGTSFEIYYDTPVNAFEKILIKHNVQEVFTNQDYEQYAIDRDADIQQLLEKHNAKLNTYKDQVVLDKDEVLKDDGKPYTIFTPYSRKWKAALTNFHLKSYPTKKYFKNFLQSPPHRIPSLTSMGFKETEGKIPAKTVSGEIVKNYTKQRDFPAIHGTSKLGIHLRFGTISIRELASYAQKINETFLNELIWRDFYHMILWHFPHINKGLAFKPAYDNIKWRNNEKEFEQWCNGKTGYPIVDAGMRELNETGFMHNRVRMITASFLCKHLLIDWRWGEAYFAQKLLDYDFAANNGGWQWAASSGCDAAPYFRVFNPTLQMQKFDKDLKYVRKWVPEFDSLEYPQPIVVHEEARKRVLEAYATALKEK